jgi:predicted ATPase/nucleoside phosphorylase/SpoVK/Ycf46/Vps4 family AAA+-type ATPase
MSMPPVDFGILTIREDELEAVLDRFTDKLETVKGRRHYNLRRVELQGGDAYTVAVLRCIEQGNGEAQAAARDLLEDLDPQWLLVVGIAGGVPAYEFTLGDVVVSTRVLDFSVEALLKDAAREYALAGGPIARDAATLVANLPAMREELAGWNAPDAIGMERPPVVLDPARFYGDEAWKADVLAKLTHQFKDKPPRPPLVTAGAIASSDRLVKDAELLAVWRKLARQTLAVEMESAGVYRATQSRGTPFLAIRGLSDVVGYQRDPAWTSYACRTAAAFAYGLLKARPIEPRVRKVSTAAPAPLPRIKKQFMGRDALADRLRDLLLGEPPPRVLLLGPAGIGKTTLALAVLHRHEVAERFGTRRHFVRLDAARDPDGITGAIVGALGLMPEGDPFADVCAALGREPCVVVLDNLETAWEQDREGTEALLGKLAVVPALALIATVRGAQRPAGSSWREVMTLRPLQEKDAMELFGALTPEHRDHPDLASLVAPLGGVPLAIELFAGAASGNDLTNLATEWEERRAALLVEEGVHPDRLTSWAVSLDMSFQSKRMTPEARRLTGLLAELPNGIAQQDLGAVLPGAGSGAARVLSQVGLAFFDDDRLRMLPPIREYAAKAYPAAPEDRDRAIEWYGDLARELGPKVGKLGGAEAIGRLGPEMANIELVIHNGLGRQEAAACWIDTALAIVAYGTFSGQPLATLLLRARDAAQAASDSLREARCTFGSAQLAYYRRDHNKATASYDAALLLYRQSGDTRGEARCIHSLGNIALRLGTYRSYEAARERYKAALLLYQQANDTLGKADSFLRFGDVARLLKDEDAQARYEEASSLYRDIHDILGEAMCSRRLGAIALDRSDYDTAQAYYERAMPLYREVGALKGEANCSRGVGHVALHRSEHEAARAKYEQALRLYRQVGEVKGEADTLYDLGTVALFLSQLDDAVRYFHAALHSYRRIDDRLGENNVVLRLEEVVQGRAKHANGSPSTLPPWADTITELRIKNLRTLADVRLRLDGLTVLIGDNGTGKSSIIEACEILRRAAGPSFGEELFGVHGGPLALLRLGTTELTLGVRVEGGGEPIDYELSIDDGGQISREALVVAGRWTIIDRKSLQTADVVGFALDGGVVTYKDQKIDGRRLVLTSFGARHLAHPALGRVVSALERIEVQVGFEVTPNWLARSTQRLSALRSPAVAQPIDRLSKLGTNLANAYAALKNDFGEEHWQATMAYVRLGLGDTVESVNVRPDPGGGSIALWLKHAGVDQQLPASALSDGTLAYLAVVALYRLDTHASLLAFDEPELHLHPELLMRALDFFEAMARDRPVLLATHSDRLLDGLSEPARAVVLCELDEERRTRLVRPDKGALDRWLERYRGLGDVRSAGHQASVMTREDAP